MQGTRPLGAIILVKFQFFQFWGHKPPPLSRSRWNLASPAKFHLDRCSVSPLWGEKPQNQHASKSNTGRAACGRSCR